MEERLQKLLSARGVASRRQAEEMISQGRVQINGRTASLGDRAGPGDTVLLDGAPLPPPPQYVYILLNKPRGYVTTLRDERGRRTVMELLAGGAEEEELEGAGAVLLELAGGVTAEVPEVPPTGDSPLLYAAVGAAVLCLLGLCLPALRKDRA